MARILSDMAYARSGDKGPNVNVGIVFERGEDYLKAVDSLTSSVVKSYFGDMVKGDVVRYELPNLNSLNFILNDSKCLWKYGSYWQNILKNY